MKKNILLFAFIAAFFALTSCHDDDSVTPSQELLVLTFEDADYAGTGRLQSSGKADWSSLIDTLQYGGGLLYGPTGYGSSQPYYFWNDEGRTELSSTFPCNWGAYCYWGGGHAISNYVGSALDQGSYLTQLTVYKDGAATGRTGGGHNGSDNFCIHNGYADGSPYSATALPAICFADSIARIIDHMYVHNTLYAVSCYFEGNGYTPKVSDSDWVKIVATGYGLGGRLTGTTEFYLCNGPQHIVTEWTKWDLSDLGAVVRVEFNLTGSSVNTAGTFSQPAYFAYDDVAVRFRTDIN